MTYRITDTVRPVQLLAPVTVAGTVTTAVVDRNNWTALVLLLALGANGGTLDASHYGTPTIQESDTLVAADFTAVADADLLYTFSAVAAGADVAKAQRAEYIGSKRYVRVVLTVTGTVSVVMGVIALLGLPAMAAATEPTTGLTAA